MAYQSRASYQGCLSKKLRDDFGQSKDFRCSMSMERPEKRESWCRQHSGCDDIHRCLREGGMGWVVVTNGPSLGMAIHTVGTVVFWPFDFPPPKPNEPALLAKCTCTPGWWHAKTWPYDQKKGALEPSTCQG